MIDRSRHMKNRNRLRNILTEIPAIILLLCCWSIVQGQDDRIVRRIAVVLVGFSQERPEAQAFVKGLQEYGYSVGRDVLIQWYSAQGDFTRIPSVMAEAIGGKPDVLVIESTPAVQEARRMTSTIPIVMAVAADPLGSGLIDSLAHPGGNITGLSMMVPDIIAKRLQLFKEAVPGIKRVGCLQDPRVPFHAKAIESLNVAAKSMGLTLEIGSATNPDEIRQVISTLRSNRAQGLFILDNPFFHLNRKTILDFATRHKMPVTYGTRAWIEEGALLSYSANISDQFRRAAYYVNRIFKGAKPSELPVEQPTKFELVVNLKTARTLHLNVPESIKVFATEIIH